MNATGVYCTIKMGPGAPFPLSATLTEVVHQVEVVHRDVGRSGFKITFYAGRQKTNGGTLDYAILQNPQVQILNRVKILVTLQGSPQQLMDGIITDIQVQNDDKPGNSKIVVTGQDISFMMDRKQVQKAYPEQSEASIAQTIIARYANYQLIPKVITPSFNDTPNQSDWTPRQYGTDYAYLNKLAKRFGYVFYVATGPTPDVNTAYWGPPKRTTTPQPALAVNMGYGRNVRGIQFQYNALAAVTVAGELQDRLNDQTLPINVTSSTRTPLSKKTPKITDSQQLLVYEEGGLDYAETQARAQSMQDRGRDRVVVAEGSLDTERYGHILQARAVVGVHGAGLTYDGLYYVEQVTHTLGIGYYQQQFTLTRDGIGSTVSVVSV